MHRHGYTGRKLGRTRDERRRLMKNLATSLFLDEKVTTTLPKAKELVPYAERLITRAKRGTLHDRRAIISGVFRDDAAHKLVDEIAPSMKRDSGHLRLIKGSRRKGDNTQLATITFVDEITKNEVAPSPKAKKAAAKASEKKPATAKVAPKKKSATATKSKESDK